MKQKLMLLLAAIFIACTSAAFAEVPRLINYQGYITDADGVPANGTKQVVFRLYENETGGIPLWSEEHTIVAQNGVFTVLLGSMPASPLDLNFDKQYYLEIVVDGVQLNSRLALASAAYSIAAANGVPTGVITMWSGDIGAIPAGWALCDGTNGTPDLRDRFIVGAGTTYTVGSTGGETQHILTVDEMPSHSHDFSGFGGSATATLVATSTAGGTPNRVAQGGGSATGNYPKIAGSGSGQAHENRPPYYAMAYIIKK